MQQEWDCIVLPGGEQGTEAMRDCKQLTGALKEFKQKGKMVAACGEAPALVFASIAGFLRPGATCFPLKRLVSLLPQPTSECNVVLQRENVMTCQGYGSCVAFALFIAQELIGVDTVELTARSMLFDRSGKRAYRYARPRPHPGNESNNMHGQQVIVASNVSKMTAGTTGANVNVMAMPASTVVTQKNSSFASIQQSPPPQSQAKAPPTTLPLHNEQTSTHTKLAQATRMSLGQAKKKQVVKVCLCATNLFVIVWNATFSFE